MKTKHLIKFFSIIIATNVLLLNFVFSQSKLSDFSSCTMYYGGESSLPNINLANRLFKTKYTSTVGQDPGNLNLDFLGTASPYSAAHPHKGVDYRARSPFPVYAVLDGKVISNGSDTYGQVAIYNRVDAT